MVEDVGRQIETTGFRIEPDSYSGFGLFNRSQRSFKRSVLKFPIRFLRDIPIDQQTSGLPVSVMSRGNVDDFIALIGSIMFVNHSSDEKTQFFQKFPYQGSLCVRLKVKFYRMMK